MATTRDSTFTLIDYSSEIELIPRGWSLITSMGLFDKHYISTTVAQVERVQEINTLFDATERGADRNYVGSENVVTRNFNTKLFSLDRALNAADILNLRKYGTGAENKTLEDEVTRIMARLRRSHSSLVEAAQAAAIFNGTSYSGPNLAPEYNYYTEWGVTQQTANVDFTNGLVDPREVIELQARQYITTAAQDEASQYVMVAFCSPEWFSAFISHPQVEESYKYFSSEQDPMRARLGGLGHHRSFTTKGVTYIEYQAYVPSGEAYIMPVGVEDMFRMYFSPADDISIVGSGEVGRELYMWYKESEFDRRAKVESETSFVCVLARPELIVKSVGTFA